jgi:hypothetical protein
MSSMGEEENTNKWHILLRDAKYMYANIGGDYNSIYVAKQGHLQNTILPDWAKLAN